MLRLLSAGPGLVFVVYPAALARFEGQVALVHSDIGTGDADSNAAIAGFLSGYLARFLRPGGLVISDQAMSLPDAEPVALPEGVKPGRYFIHRRC